MTTNMRTAPSRLFTVITAMIAMTFCTAGFGSPSAATDSAIGATPWSHRASACERVTFAADHGTLSLKDAVMTKARLQFAPERVAAPSAFSAQAGEIAAFDPCRSGFYKDVHRVYGALSPEERAELRALSLDLQAIMDARAATVDSSSILALPNFGLDKEVKGKYCIVHYTLAGANACTDKTYAELIATYVDKAASGTMTMNFRKALAEGYTNGVGKLHVYVISLGAGAYGEWVDVTSVSGSKMAGYIKLANNFDTVFDATTWQVSAKGVCYHEYFHGIQSAYNAWSDLWFLEGTAVWAQHYYGKDNTFFKGVFDSAESVVKNPNDLLWANTYRKYSTCTLAYFMSDNYSGYKFFATYFLNSEAKNDAVELLKDTLVAQGTTFDVQYRRFWAAMATKTIKSLKKYLPDVTAAATYNSYGVKNAAGQVQLLGAKIYRLEPQVGARGSTLIAVLTPGATGKPEGLLVPGEKLVVKDFADGKGWIADFGKKVKKAALIVTDTTYAGQDATARPYTFGVIVPSLEIISINSVSPITSGDSSPIDIEYNLLGTYPGEAFPVDFQVKEKGPDVADNATGKYDMNPGENQIFTLYFNTGFSTVGSYSFAFEMRVPDDSWAVPQVKSKCKTSVKVEPPSGEASVPHATESRVPCLTRDRR